MPCLLRGAWLAKELLITCEKNLDSVMLRPGSSGIFEVSLNNQQIFSRKVKGIFPEAKVLKQIIRDYIDPHCSLGQSDKNVK